MMKPVEKFAFFDVDETIIYEKSMFSILSQISRFYDAIKPDEINQRLQKMRNAGLDRAMVNRAFYRELKGLLREDVIRISEHYIHNKIKNGERFIIPNVTSQMELYRSKGYEPVFVSGSATDFIRPLAEYLNVVHCLATELCITSDGKYTGEILGDSMIGSGKRTAILNFLSGYSIDPLACAGFGDHLSDLAFLEITGEPHVVASGDKSLVSVALQRSWPVIYP
ncbi:HAD family hydrolase [Xenorhabdus stockiae]|uniref:HAD family hydrolase n=1 Tax=Xenorhabdus stockiae TaxID=351614 RepID=UPI0040635BBE